MKFLVKWPSYALLPAFTPFTFSGTLIKGQRYFTLSFNWTWFNLAFSALGLIYGPFIQTYFNKLGLDWSNGDLIYLNISLAYLPCFLSFALLNKTQDGICIKRTAFQLDTFEEIQLDQVETVDVACQASTIRPANQEVPTTIIQVWKDVACQTEPTEPKNDSKMKALEWLSMVELVEAFN